MSALTKEQEALVDVFSRSSSGWPAIVALIRELAGRVKEAEGMAIREKRREEKSRMHARASERDMADAYRLDNDRLRAEIKALNGKLQNLVTKYNELSEKYVEALERG